MQTSEMPVCDNAYNTGVIFFSFFSNFPQFFCHFGRPWLPHAKKSGWCCGAVHVATKLLN